MLSRTNTWILCSLRPFATVAWCLSNIAILAELAGSGLVGAAAASGAEAGAGSTASVGFASVAAAGGAASAGFASTAAVASSGLALAGAGSPFD